MNLMSHLLARTAVTFWLWLVIVPGTVAIFCPEECRCDTRGYYVTCCGRSLTGVLEKGLFFHDNIQYSGDDKVTSYSDTDIDNKYTDTKTDTETKAGTYKEFETDTNMDTEKDMTRKQKETLTLKSRPRRTQTNTQGRKLAKLRERRREKRQCNENDPTCKNPPKP